MEYIQESLFGKTCTEPIQATAERTSAPCCRPSAKSQTPTPMCLDLRKENGGGAGCIVGDGYSLAWRTYDAQHWGVTIRDRDTGDVRQIGTSQRRRRIYLVADFRGERAGKVFFEPESVRWNPAQGAQARETAPVHAAGGDCGGAAAGSIGAFHLQQDPICGKISPCIGVQDQATVGVFMGGQGDKAGGIAYSEGVAPTLRSAASGSNQTPDVVYPALARTLTAEHDASPCVDRGQNFVCCPSSFGGYVEGVGTLKANGGDIGGGRKRWWCFDARGNGNGGGGAYGDR